MGDGGPASKRGSQRAVSRLRPESLLLEAADILAGSPGVRETLDRVTLAARRALSADRATCYILDLGGSVTMVHTTERDAARRELIDGAVGRDMPIGRILRSRSSPILAVADAGRSRLVPSRLAEHRGVGALMAVRLDHADTDPEGEAALGWLFLSWSSPRSFSTADRRLALAFAPHAAHALSNARLRESAQRASEVGLRAQRIGRMGGWEWDAEAGRVEYSPEGLGVLGLEPGMPIPPELYVELAHPDDRATGSAVVTELVAGRRDDYEIQHRIVRSDGMTRHVVSRGEVIERDDDGRPTRVGGMLQDITDSVGAAERLGRSEAHLTEAQRIASLGSWAWELDTGHIEWSAEFSRICGLPETAAQSFEAFLEAVHPADRERVQVAVAAFVEKSAPLDVVCRVARPDGTIRIIHSHGEAVHDETGRATSYVGAVQDVTERVTREDRLRESEERNRRLAAEQAALRRVATAVASGATPEAVFGQVAAEVGSLLDVRAGVVWRFEGDHSVAVGSWGHRRSQVGVAFPLAGEGAVPMAWRTGRAATVHYPSLADTDPTAARVRPQGYRSGVAAPIALDGKPWGAVLAATSEERVFSDEEKRGLERFADLIGLAIANAEARSQLLSRAATDPLTGLANYRAVHETLQREVARAHRHRRSLAVALFDLDHFKEVNDIHGHQVGDNVLEAIASTLQGVARPGDLVGRLGGEEFVWLMPETDALGAYEAAERFRALVGSSEPAPGVALTVSAGICDLERAGSASELMALADGALYWAKAHGRDISFLYTPEVVEALSAEDRAERLERTRILTGLRALARAVDAKDPSTLRHSERVAGLAGDIAAAHGWTVKRIADLRDAALVHDVGKIGIPDAILLKPSALSAEEYEIIKRHSPLGAEIAAEILSEEQVRWIRGHHERIDGHGYPDGLPGDTIPDGARILALADSLEVMTGVRAYQRTVSWKDAMEECRSQAGTQFDPELVALLPEVAPPGAPRTLSIVR